MQTQKSAQMLSEVTMEKNGKTDVDLSSRRCVPCEGGTPPLPEEEVAELLARLEGWTREGEAIAKGYEFKNYGQTMAFVNAVAWVAMRQGHHPDLEVGYNRCRVRFTTHAIGGLSENDFICAAKVDALLAL